MRWPVFPAEARDGDKARTLSAMTRENKLALVVGFGLILLVGILISDHFSQARHQQAAALAPVVDPLSDVRRDDPDLIALRTAQPRPEETVEAPPSRPPSSRPKAIEMGAPRIGLDAKDAQELPYRFHHVASNETLSAICDTYYRDPSLVHALAAYNGIDDPDLVSAGTSIRIPPGATLVRGGAAPTRTTDVRPQAKTTDDAVAKAPPKPTTRSYTVVKDDNLSKIAKRMLGSGNRWPAIYELNRDKLKSPDSVREGMVLRIPARN